MLSLLNNGIGGAGRRDGQEVYVVRCDEYRELTGLAIFDHVVLCAYTAHVVNLKEEGREMHNIKSVTSPFTYLTPPISPTRLTWTLTLVYSSPWTLLERGMEEDRSSQTTSSSCFDLSPCQNQTMSRLQRLSSSLRDSKRPRLLEESWWLSSILQSELTPSVICPPSVLNQ